jgi:cation:H+ antiporter
MNVQAMLFLAAGLVALFLGGNLLVRSSARLASALGVPVLVVGLTVIAIGTSAPEMVVSVSAAVNGQADIALGNVVGSNVANACLILGIAALVLPVRVNAKVVRREIPVMLLVSGAALLASLDGQIGQIEGVLFVAAYFAFTLYLYVDARKTPDTRGIREEVADIQQERDPERISRPLEAVLTLTALGILIGGAQLTVTGAVSIAQALGVSELVIGLTVVAIGTSLPEITASLVAARRGHDDIAIGNVVGSNIANILLVLGVTALIQPVNVDYNILTFEMPFMLLVSILLLPLGIRGRLGRRSAVLLLALYVIFISATLL